MAKAKFCQSVFPLTSMKTLIKLYCLILLWSELTQAFRIIIIFHIPARSHFLLGSSLAKGMSDSGHEVTFVSPFNDSYTPKNGTYKPVLLTGFRESFEKRGIFKYHDPPLLETMLAMNRRGNELTEQTLKHPNVQKLLNSEQYFDAVIIEQFMNDAMKGIAHHFKAPLILFSTMGANRWVNPLFGNPSPPSYVSDFFLSYSSRMTFLQRTKNTLFGLVAELNNHILFFPEQNKILKRYFPNAPDLSILNYNSSLALLNSHVSINAPVPLQPNMVNIAGFHIKHTKKLPYYLQEFIDKAENGVIYFSMGSNLKGKDMPEKIVKNLLKVFGRLKQRIIWKYEEHLPNKSENVMTGEWFSQSDILAHPKVKLFITHGGLLSITETIYHGKPVLIIPIFGDQKMNAAQMLLNGYGLSLSIDDFYDMEKVLITLDELLTNQQYNQKAVHRSKIMHDQPLKPMEAAVFWVEYVIRNKGAPYLRNSGLHLTWYQYFGLDVYAFIIGVLILSVCFVILFHKRFWPGKKIGKEKNNTIKKNN